MCVSLSFGSPFLTHRTRDPYHKHQFQFQQTSIKACDQPSKYTSNTTHHLVFNLQCAALSSNLSKFNFSMLENDVEHGHFEKFNAKTGGKYVENQQDIFSSVYVCCGYQMYLVVPTIGNASSPSRITTNAVIFIVFWREIFQVIAVTKWCISFRYVE